MIFLYGIINTSKEFTFTEQASGRFIYNIAYNNISMVVSRADANDDMSKPESGILTYHRVMEYLLEHYTVLPIKFGTLLPGEKVVYRILHDYESQFSPQLQKLHGKVEMGVKVLWDIYRSISEYQGLETSKDLVSQKLQTDSPGHKFLLSKYRERAAQRYLRQKAAQKAAPIHQPLADMSIETCRYILRTPALMLSGAYLITRENVDVFRAELFRLSKDTPECKFLMSGPWPPYNFARINCITGGDNDENGFRM